MNLIKHIITATICVTLLTSFTGCISAGNKTSKQTIYLSNTGRITFRKKPVTLAKLPTMLKNMGVKPRTPLSVEIPANTSPTTIHAVSTTLASAGYRRVMFKKPKVSSASLKK